MNDKLLYLIKSQGWRVASNMVGGPDVLFKLLDITPTKFLHSFNGMGQSFPSGDVTSYGECSGCCLFLHDTMDNLCFISYEEIWSLFEPKPSRPCTGMISCTEPSANMFF